LWNHVIGTDQPIWREITFRCRTAVVRKGEHMKRSFVAASGVALAALVVFAISGPASAAAPVKLRASTAIYDPDGTFCPTQSAWGPGFGIGGGAGIQMSLICTDIATTNGASADATITNTDGLRLRGRWVSGVGDTGLGFYYNNGMHCTGGSPRWDVELSNGGIYAFGCGTGTHLSTSSPGWTRVYFTDTDVQELSGPSWPDCFSTNTSSCGILFLQVLDDEGPDGVYYPSTDAPESAQIDSIRVVASIGSGSTMEFVIGKSGASPPCSPCSF
jgi:hypothetical protein